MFDLKKYRGVTFHDTEGWCKIWKKTDLWLGKWHEEYAKFSPEQLKVSKLGYWWDHLIQSRKSMSLKSTEELYVMTMKNDTKFEKELTCQFKIDMRNLMNFDPSTWKSQNFHFNGLLMSKVYIVWAKKVRRSNLSWNWRGMQKIWRGINSLFQNWQKEFDKIWSEHSKVLKLLILGTVH